MAAKRLEKQEFTPAYIQECVRKAACATGTQAAWILKAWRPAKQALVHRKELVLWQALHDELERVPALAKYARRMEQHGDAIIGYAAAWDIDGNPIPHESRADDIIIWNKKTGKFDLARHAETELAKLRKYPHNVNFINFKIGKPEKTGLEARKSALHEKAERIRKAVATAFTEAEKTGASDALAKMVSDLMFQACKVAPDLMTPYMAHMVNAHKAAVAADLATAIAAEAAKNAEVAKGKAAEKKKN